MIRLTYSYHHTLFRITFPTFGHATEPPAVDQPPPLGECQEHYDWSLAVVSALMATKMSFRWSSGQRIIDFLYYLYRCSFCVSLTLYNHY